MIQTGSASLSGQIVQQVSKLDELLLTLAATLHQILFDSSQKLSTIYGEQFVKTVHSVFLSLRKENPSYFPALVIL